MPVLGVVATSGSFYDGIRVGNKEQGTVNPPPTSARFPRKTIRNWVFGLVAKGEDLDLRTSPLAPLGERGRGARGLKSWNVK